MQNVKKGSEKRVYNYMAVYLAGGINFVIRNWISILQE